MEELDTITIEEIQEDFSFMEDWEERFEYLVDLSKKLPNLPSEQKTEDNLVRGCMSPVWMTLSFSGPEQRLNLQADSGALIVKGLIALIYILYQGKTPQEILAIDVEETFRQLGLERNLSPNRRNGFFSMVQKIRSSAQSLTNK